MVVGWRYDAIQANLGVESLLVVGVQSMEERKGDLASYLSFPHGCSAV